MSSDKKLTTFQKASALVPLALLSGAWTISLTTTSSASADGSDGKLPDGTTVPDRAIGAPASVSGPGEIAPGVPSGSTAQVIAGASANGIPSAALSAYQRAAQVIDSADSGCHIDWTLIAAIGRVESNHGRYGGNSLDDDGVSRPGIYGIPLDGANGTRQVRDTDAGQYDNDPRFDRAVGPMQFIPSTWSVVGVDGDGDGKRDPQDVDDAALATAVYLCSGDEDLSTTQGQRSAVYRYNHSREYVDLVLSIMKAYASGDFTAVPTRTAGTTTFTPEYGDSVMAAGTTGHHYPGSSSKARNPGRGSSSSRPGASRTSTETGTTGSSAPTGGGGSTSTPPGAGSDGGGGTTASDPSAPVREATSDVTKTAEPVVATISAGAEAVAFCSSHLPDLSSPSTDGQSTVINGCAAKIAGMTSDQAAAAIPDTLTGVVSWLGLSMSSLLPAVGGDLLP
jgi:hypothetical protein